MKHMRTSVVLGVIGITSFVGYMILTTLTHQAPEYVTSTVDTGPVQQLVSVSGVTENRQVAELGFPTGGTVTDVTVRVGDMVTAGTILATLDSRTLAADIKDGEAALERARASRAELLAGITATTRAVSNETITLKRDALARTTIDQARVVENARRTFLTNDLTALATEDDEEAPAPLISGTYTCDTEGTYTITFFGSNSASGYSFRLSGLESGTVTASVDQPTPFGTCGLRLQLAPNERYNRSVWTITIPNPDGSAYTQNRNAYEAAKTTAASQIALAEQDLALAEATGAEATAVARPEAIARANADVAQAEARLARVQSEVSDRTLTAPFTGVVTAVNTVVGEAIGTTPLITLYATDTYELIARIPEIDIGKVVVGQSALVIFDARDSTTITATITYVAPSATTIDGVAYYEARLALDESPEWLRNGLNADIDIIISEVTKSVRVPTRFVSNLTENPTVQRLINGTLATTTIAIELIGNDGYVAVSGITAGDVIVAP